MQNNSLGTFRILYLVYGILVLFFSIIFAIYAFFGFFIMESIDVKAEDDLPFNPGSIFLIIGGIGFVFATTIGVLNIVASNYLKNEKRYNFIFVMSIVNCLTGLLGILLGVFTLIELNKPEIKALFNKEESDELSEIKGN